MFASDFRRAAREALKGKWIRTALILLLAMLLAAPVGMPASNLNFEVNITGNQQYAQEMDDIQELTGIEREQLVKLFGVMGIVMLVIALYSLFVGSIVRIGIFRMGDRLIDGEMPRASMLFPRGIYKKALLLRLLMSIFISLWSLLFVIPGIIASYRYAMAEYLLYKYPQLTPMQAIAMSKQRMHGKKLRLFCLELSFIGWALLSSLPAAIGMSVTGAMIQFAGMPPLAASAPLLIGGIVSFAGSLLVNAYFHIAMCIFLREQDHPWHAHQAETQYGWDNSAVETEAYDSEAGQQMQNHAVDTEPLARELFHRYGCSRERMMAAGEMEKYASYRVDSSVEQRWLRERGQALMLRFSHDPDALDELLPLIGEYGMDELLDRAIERIERHIRQNTLPGEALMSMAGRCLALAVSGVFDERESYVQRKRVQLGDMADRLAVHLEQDEPDGGWRSAYAMICRMKESE